MTPPLAASATRPDWRLAWAIFALLVIVYNANGREMPTYDSQPTKLAARELVLHGRLTLDRVVAKTPEYGNRAGFQRDRLGHYRSAYSVLPALAAAVPGALLHVTGLVDLRAPLAPNLVAKLTASIMVAAAVALVFVALAGIFGDAAAFWVALGLGLGTNLWPLASGTLWQLETVTLGLALALFGWLRDAAHVRTRDVVIGALGLALAAGARVQAVPMAAVLVLGLVVRIGWRRATPGLCVLAASAAALMWVQWNWFGSVLGAAQALQDANLAAHAVTGTLAAKPWVGALGLLVSPSRGLIVFSPIVLIPIFAAPGVWARRNPNGEGWWLLAAAVQFAGYSCYSMWWGGHTYGPRYLVDALVALAPAACVGMHWVRRTSWRKAVAGAALAFSVAVAATGAFVYPADMWNQGEDVDRNHQRLWDWKDMQIVRCWRTGLSPQNFSLIDWGSVRRPDAEKP
jgi:hypothetical protein